MTKPVGRHNRLAFPFYGNSLSGYDPQKEADSMLDHLGVWSGAAGLAVALIFGVGPHMGFKMPRWLARAGFVTGIILLAASHIIFIFQDDGVSRSDSLLLANNGNSITSVPGKSNTVYGPTIINPPPARDPNGLYQQDKLIGRAGPVQSNFSGVIVFHDAVFSEYVNPDVPLRYGDLLLHCPDAPQLHPGVISGGVKGAVAPVRCTVIGNANLSP
jgi:hypothetical protein